MELLSFIQRKLFTSLLLLCLFVVALLAPLSDAISKAGTIQRTLKQQILSTIPADSEETPEPFITSPSGKYVGYLRRTKTVPGAGGFGNDFCYVEVRDTSTGQSVWESECAPVSDANACTLVFDDAGLEVFDGSQSVWNSEADGNHVDILELVDEGDMRIIDKDGELAWKASDAPLANQGCGAPGSPGLAPESPPFAGAIGAGSNLPFGQQQPPQPQPSGVGVEQPQPIGTGVQQQSPQTQPNEAAGAQQPQAPSQGGIQQQQAQPSDDDDDDDDVEQQSENSSVTNQPLGSGSRPLVDNTPFDSGSPKGVCAAAFRTGVALAAWYVFLLV